MSLLMQALKKAERSKQNSLLDEEVPDKPSEAYDEVLALTPQDLAPERFPPKPAPVEFSLEPIDGPGLVALDVPYVPEDTLEQIPVLMPAEEAPHDPTPPQSRLGGAHKHAPAGRIRPELELMPPHAQQARNERSELTLQDVPPELVPGLIPDITFAPHTSLSKDIGPALQSEPIAPAIDPDGATAPRAPAPEATLAAPELGPAPGPAEARTGNRRQGNGQRATDTTASDAAGMAAAAQQHHSQPGQLSAAGAGTGRGVAGSSVSGRGATGSGVAGRGMAGGDAAGRGEAGRGLAGGSVSDSGATGSGVAGGAAGGGGATASGGTTGGGATITGDDRAKPGAAARARAAAEARAAAAEDKVGWDPARIRLAVLSGVLLLIVALFGYIYWRATTAPGPGANLPMVPMPPPDAGGAKQGVIVAPPPGSLPGADSAAASADPGAGGAAGANMAGTAAGNAPNYGAAAGGASPAGAASVAAQAAGGTSSAARGPVPGAHSAPPAGGGTVMASPEEIERALQMQGGQQGVPPAASGGAAAAGGAGSGSGTGAGAGTGGGAAGAGTAPARRAETTWASNDIKVSHSTTAPRVSPALQSGYQSLLAGDLPAAAEHYSAALRQDPNNRDALLGNAAVAVRRNDAAQASASYMRLLELNPSDPDALAGLLSLRPGDTGQSELRLKDLLRKAPDSAPLQFALGNLYSRQARWTDAQQAYFRAYTASPDNPDYAFNLAVGLDRLNQPKLALNYYQRALSLAQAGPAGFDSEAVRARMRQLDETH
ncbi:tetratricopeptide repeat protein [Pseudoduganella sp. LjRoot289]|uniref:tetratricopeptide repeat protein n=1 Tax=Pseudoduganella sp. LjRoot289 TaxID=3342314 RepID=UPI003ECF61E2